MVHLCASGRAFASYFECKDEGAADDADDETNQPLQTAFQLFAHARVEAPMGAEKNEPYDEPFTAAEKDEESHVESQLYHLVVNKRKDNQKFTPFKMGETTLGKEREATAIFQISNFDTSPFFVCLSYVSRFEKNIICITCIIVS